MQDSSEKTESLIPEDLSSYSLKTTGNFKKQQFTFPKVRGAYENKSPYIAYVLEENKIDPKSLELYIQAFKHDGVVKIWAKNKRDEKIPLAQAGILQSMIIG